MPGKRKTKNIKKTNGGQGKLARSLDQLAEFDKFTRDVMPKLKKAVLENWSPEKTRKEFAPLMQVMMVKKGIEGNFNAIKDTLDRNEGTAIQRIEQKTLYAKMSKREKAALTLQKLKDAKLIDDKGRPIIEVISKVLNSEDIDDE